MEGPFNLGGKGRQERRENVPLILGANVGRGKVEQKGRGSVS